MQNLKIYCRISVLHLTLYQLKECLEKNAKFDQKEIRVKVDACTGMVPCFANVPLHGHGARSSVTSGDGL